MVIHTASYTKTRARNRGGEETYNKHVGYCCSWDSGEQAMKATDNWEHSVATMGKQEVGIELAALAISISLDILG